MYEYNMGKQIFFKKFNSKFIKLTYKNLHFLLIFLFVFKVILLTNLLSHSSGIFKFSQVHSVDTDGKLS